MFIDKEYLMAWNDYFDARMTVYEAECITRDAAAPVTDDMEDK